MEDEPHNDPHLDRFTAPVAGWYQVGRPVPRGPRGTTTAVTLDADDLSRYAPPDVALRLHPAGPGSRPDILGYVETVLRQRTAVNPDTTVERIAAALVTSILSRLGAGWSIATGSAVVALTPAPAVSHTDHSEGTDL